MQKFFTLAPCPPLKIGYSSPFHGPANLISVFGAGRRFIKGIFYLDGSARRRRVSRVTAPGNPPYPFSLPAGQDCSRPKNNDIRASSRRCRLSPDWRPRRNISRCSSLRESTSGPETRLDEGEVRFLQPRPDFSNAEFKAFGPKNVHIELRSLKSREEKKSREVEGCL